MSVESVTPYGTGEGKREQIARAFDRLADRYDLLNRILSLGLDRGWRRKALRLLVPEVPARILDVATGTADFALAAARLFPEARITGVDLSSAMLAVGRAKVQRAGLAERVALEVGDGLSLGAAEGAYDAATVAFGVRNFADLPAGLRELHRVLKPGGSLVILELSRPSSGPLALLHRLYVSRWVPLLGRLLSGHAREYAYLPASVAEVPQGDAMLGLLRAAGFEACRCERYTFGACSCYLARRGRFTVR